MSSKVFTMNFKKMSETAKVPTRGSDYAAGYDLYADVDDFVTIEPHETAKIPTGIAVEIPDGYAGGVFARSGLATKRGLAPINEPGLVDSDYRGQIFVALHNHTDEPKSIEPQERIAQLVIFPYVAVKFNEVNELSETVRGEEGFGSSGTK